MSLLPQDRRSFLQAAFLVEGAFIPIAFLFAWAFPIEQSHDPLLLAVRDWNPIGIAWGIAAALPMFGVFWLLYHRPFGPFRVMRSLLEEVLRPGLRACRWYDLVWVAALAGLGEEVLFRGALQPRWGLIGSSLVFGLLHAVTPTYALFATLAGLYLGLLMQMTGTVWAPIIAHGLYDFLAFLVLRAGPDAEQKSASGATGGGFEP